MSNNLLELLKEHLSGDVVSNLATLIGESPNNTESALQTALPALLAGLVDKSRDAKSIDNLLNQLVEGNHDGSVISNLGALSRGGEETTKLISEGANLLTSLFGDKVASITDLVANASGISKNSSTTLLGFIMPNIMGLIGRNLKIENTEYATGLAELLSGQSGFLKNFIPAGLSNLMAGEHIAKTSTAMAATTDHVISDFDKAANTLDSGYTAPNAVSETFDNIGDTIENVAGETLSSAKSIVEGFGESASQFGSHIVDEGKEFAHSAADAFEEDAGEGRKFLPWILLAAALALAWGLLKSCSAPDTATDTSVSSTTAPAVTEPPTTTSPPAEQVVAAPPTPTTPEPAKAEAPVVDNASDFFEKTLSTGYVIKAAKDGFESKLVGFIEGNKAISKDLWFNMDGIIFDTNKASIKAESNTQINHIAEILKAYPNVKIKIGGYTDTTGKANANIKLSNNRANAVKKALVTQGIKAGRLDAEGYGSEHPVASNDTEEGRQQNRRIDVRVTEK
jgi:OmpA-OmpF porin, OOP family